MLVLAGCASPPPASEVVVRVEVDGPEDLEELEALGGDVWTEHAAGWADVRLARRALPALPFAWTMRIEDLHAAVAASLAPAGPGFWEEWHPIDELDARLDELDAAWGREVDVVELGASLEGRPIRGVEIRGTGVGPGLPVILVTGCQHAREWIGASSALWVAEHLSEGNGADPEVDALLARYRVTVVPVVNPDGYDHTWTTDRMWRKNRRANDDGTRGVDLNRNWDQAWGGPGSSGSPASNNYRGTAPFSEPETAAVRDYVLAHPRAAVHLDLHSTGQLVLSPWGSTPEAPPDAAHLEQGGADAAAAMGVPSGTSYDAGPLNTRLYPASGIGIDWSYGVHGLDAWLLELRDRGGQYGFLLPADQIVPTAREVWAGLLSLTDGAQARLSLRVPELWAEVEDESSACRSDPGERVGLYLSRTGPGTTVLPDGGELELGDATLVGTERAGERGRARFTFAPDAADAGQTLWFQAWDGARRSMPVAREVY